MSEYADGFDDGKGEKFDELMEEIVSLREQLKECSSAFDRQQQQLDRNAEQLAALRKDASSKWAFLEWRDRAEKAEAEIVALREALSRLIEVHDAMGGMCSPERILAEEALAKEEGK